MIRQCHIRNYSIYLRRFDDGQYYLFSYFEYCGDNYAADMAKMAADPANAEMVGLLQAVSYSACRIERKASGGRRWRKCFIWSEALADRTGFPNRADLNRVSKK